MTKGGHLHTRNAQMDEQSPQTHVTGRMMHRMMHRKDLLPSAPKMRKVSSEITSEKSALGFWTNGDKSCFPGPDFGTVSVLHGVSSMTWHCHGVFS